MKQQVIAAVAGITLASLAVAGTFASQDMSLLEDPTETPTEIAATETPSDATETPTDPTETATPDGTETEEPVATETPVDPTGTPDDATETPTPEATGTPTDGTPTLEPTATPADATPTAEVSATPVDDDDVSGIPDSNPSKHPEDGDGVCEKGETIVKTTPSGKQVTVPCHAGGDDDEEGEEEGEGETSQRRGNGKNR